MKKNMLAVLILILTVVNITLTAVLMFTVLPNAKQTDNLITRLMQIIDLELESPLPTGANTTWSIDDVEKYELEEMQTNLAKGDDGKVHYAQIRASLTINTKDEDYKTLGPKVDTMKSDIRSYIISETSRCTFEELNTTEKKEEVKQRILDDIQTLFGSRFIVDVTVDYLFQ